MFRKFNLNSDLTNIYFRILPDISLFNKDLTNTKVGTDKLLLINKVGFKNHEASLLHEDIYARLNYRTI